MTKLHLVKPSTEAEKITHTVNDTIEITPNSARAWKAPPFQRPLRVNDRVMKLMLEIKKSGVVPGTITLGLLAGEHYLIDGQHRREAFLLSELPIGYCDVRVLHVKTMIEMAREFFNLNSQLVNMRPDDFLKALESSITQLQKVRKACAFVGYDMVRRNEKSPIVSMSNLLRMWVASSKEVPGGGGLGAVTLAETLSSEEAQNLIEFATLAFEAWGRDSEFHRLWGSLNMQLCMWIYRRMVCGQNITSASRVTRIDKMLFKKGLLSLSANAHYLDWLVGRQATDRDRSPGYGRVKKIFVDRIQLETGKKPLLPSPAWASHLSGSR